MKTLRTNIYRNRAFTLIEILLAVVIFGLVLAAINTVFYSALRLRKSSTDALERSLPAQQAFEIIRKDLQGMALPGGTIAGSFQVGVASTNMVEQGATQFSTTTGTLTEFVAGGAVQRVTYALREPEVRTSIGGRDLVRTVTRNPLATMADDTPEQFLLSDVQQIQFSFWDGTQWRNTWDSAADTNNVPRGIRVEIAIAPDLDRHTNAPIQIVVPIMVQASTNTTTS